MSWMMDEYSKLAGHYSPGIITGKPIALGGSAGRGDATARGGVYVTRQAAKYLKKDLKGASVAIQGFGNAGSFAATLFESILGCKVVAASDTKGGVYNPDGITNEELLELDVDILVPAALEGVLTKDNADKVKASIVCELANGPTTPEADEILHKNGVFVLPDFLANAGGVTVSYFEWVQNNYGYYWEEDEVHEKLDTKISKAFWDVVAMREKYNVDNRTAAYLVSVNRVGEAMKWRGWV